MSIIKTYNSLRLGSIQKEISYLEDSRDTIGNEEIEIDEQIKNLRKKESKLVNYFLGKNKKVKLIKFPNKSA